MTGMRIDHTKKQTGKSNDDYNSHMSSIDQALAKINPFCKWKSSTATIWFTQCGQGFGFPGDPEKDHGQIYCANCGKKIDFRKKEEKTPDTMGENVS